MCVIFVSSWAVVFIDAALTEHSKLCVCVCVPLQRSNTTCWRFLYISCVIYCKMCAIRYLLVCTVSQPISHSLLCVSYKVSKFIELTNICNNLVCVFARSELDRGHSPPAFLILFLRVCLLS